MTRWVVALLLVFGVGLTIFISAHRGSGETSAEVQQTQDDYYLKRFSMTVFDADGEVVQVLEGRQLTQAPNGGAISVAQPVVRLENAAGDWSLSAESGRMNAAMEQGELHDVTAVRGDPAQQLVIKTPVLKFDLKAQTASSSSGVVVTQLESKIESQMLEVDMARHRVNLSQEVQGVYFP